MERKIWLLATDNVCLRIKTQRGDVVLFDYMGCLWQS